MAGWHCDTERCSFVVLLVGHTTSLLLNSLLVLPQLTCDGNSVTNSRKELSSLDIIQWKLTIVYTVYRLFHVRHTVGIVG